MKLGKLNAAIDAAPAVYGRTKFGPIAFQKGSLKDALKAHFTEGRSQETGFKLDADGCVAIDEAPET